MADTSAGPPGQLKILHVLRAPLGGLYRHVLDLAREQIRRGHAVGLVADRTTGGEEADRTLGEIAPALALGLLRVPMRRDPHPTDGALLWDLSQHIRRLAPDVVHGHGSKGGLYARMTGFVPGSAGAIRVYTPHGGSLNFRPGSVASRIFMRAEALMGLRTDLILFESAFVAERYKQMVGTPRRLWRVVHNGIAESEFIPVAPRPDAADIVYVGELRAAKGIDTLLDALPRTARRLGRPVTAVLAGTGPDREALIQHAGSLGLGEHVTFAGPLPARDAFGRGRILVVPSRAESLPYVVLEAVGARVPIITTHVGGIPEIYGPFSARLLPPDDVDRLAGRIGDVLSSSEAARASEAESLAAFVQQGFSIDGMVDAVLASYRDALAGRAPPRRAIAKKTVAFQQPEVRR